MTVGFLKRLLKLTNVCAVLAIGLTVWSYLAHREEMREHWQPPPFDDMTVVVKGGRILIDNTTIALGAFPKPVETKQPANTKPTKLEFKAELDKLGEIKSAIVAYPPYGDTKPALIFEYKVAPIPGKGTIHAIGMGQALVTRPHSDPRLRAWNERENVRFKFVGCEPDPENPTWTLFLFDVDCDGKRIEKARWKGEVTKSDLKSSMHIRRPEETSIYRDKTIPRETPAKKPGATGPKPTVIKPVRSRAELTGPIFESAGGAMVTTESGVEYLRNNYSKVLKETHTEAYRDKSGKVTGIRIRAIAKESVANEFGIRKNDVIMKVNGNRVRSKNQAVGVVKRELNAKVRFIEVEILRAGATKILRFDASDPATRRKARNALK